MKPLKEWYLLILWWGALTFDLCRHSKRCRVLIIVHGEWTRHHWAIPNVGHMIRYRGSRSCRLNRQMIIGHVIWLKAEVDKPSACDTVWFRLLASESELHSAEIPALSPPSLICVILLFAFVFRSKPYDFVLSPLFICCALSLCACMFRDCPINSGICFPLVFFATLLQLQQVSETLSQIPAANDDRPRTKSLVWQRG